MIKPKRIDLSLKAEEPRRTSSILSKLSGSHLEAQLATFEKFNEQLEEQTIECELAAEKDIHNADLAYKLSALRSGIERWKKGLCNVAKHCYRTIFKLAMANPVGMAEYIATDVAHDLTEACLSAFLGDSSLTGTEENSNGRVLQFIRHSCGGWPDVFGDLLIAEEDHESDNSDSGAELPEGSVFQLPSWAAPRGLGAYLNEGCQPPKQPLSVESTKDFIQKTEAEITGALREAVYEAQRDAIIELGINPDGTKTPAPAPNHELRRRPGPKRKPNLIACKAEIRAIKQKHPDWGPRDICVEMDKRAAHNEKLSPGRCCEKDYRLWIDYYDDKRTKNAISKRIWDLGKS